MLSLGIDIGSSSVKVSVFDTFLNKIISSGQYPDIEMDIIAHQPGWAEQQAETWWEAFLKAYSIATENIDSHRIKSIGIAYQMHGLVCLDKNGIPLRPSIIWCDSRAVNIGKAALKHLGADYAFTHLLNSPGNFTASKLNWVKTQEPEVFEKIHKICLPGDYLGLRLTGSLTTTISSMSEGVFYDFKHKTISKPLLGHYGIDSELLPELKNSFDNHGTVKPQIARLLNVDPQARLCYKSGDQPNNAFSLNVLQAGEVAATAGTSGVVYGVSDHLFIDYSQRVNSFAHVNYTPEAPRIGILLCINGVGSANSWIKKITHASDFNGMNAAAAKLEPGSDGLIFLPFGNGAERMLGNVDIGASMSGLNFNRHNDAHLYRAVQEGIAFAFMHGMEAFAENKIDIKVIRAGKANMFLSPLFTQIISTLFDIPLELYDTDGAAGAARGAVVGAKQMSMKEVLQSLNKLETIEPNPQDKAKYLTSFGRWKQVLLQKIQDQK